MAHVNIVTSIIFGGISGSAVADTAALGKIFIPSMYKEGYDKAFSTAVTLASSILAPIIPPSLIMVLYGAIMSVSIAGLFAAGIVPGFIVGIGLMTLTGFISKKRNYPKRKEKVILREFFMGTIEAIPALIMPVIILGGILGGIFTPTEAAAVAVGYALFLAFIYYRNLSLKDLYILLVDASVTMGVVALIICSGTVLGWIVASEHIPETVAESLLSISGNKYIILLMVNFLLIFVGMFMEIIAAMLILCPVLAYAAISVGCHPLHVGIMMCMNLNIAQLTPPMGGLLFIAMVIGRVSLGEILKELWPFLLVHIFVLFLVVYIPDIAMFVPRLLGLID